MLLDFNIKIENLDGTTSDIETCKQIGLALYNQAFTVGDDIKKDILARKIYQKGIVDVDKADLELIKKAVKFIDPRNPHAAMHPGMRAQISSALNDAKEVVE